ncbi:hypothetical protein [Acinetobacter equi]|uniref:Uncharacterized protein n=1 Tax=Acinetobacter equi TaxID=1324350 RepID=A0A0N9V5L4_9GAMM|nr:hypothetical protein [Acinetobacter equi]ALH94519.1 hypothetical protein AOY20_02605 [Acinetobacter equi]
MKTSTFLSICLVFISSFSLTSSIFAITTLELQNLVQCNNLNIEDYRHFSDHYDEKLRQLGWKQDFNLSQYPIYIYTHSKPFVFFERPTQEIAISRNTFTAIYRDVDIQDLSNTLDIPPSPFLNNSSRFQGEKLVHIVPATNHHLTYYIKQVLLEVENSSSTALLGCRFEIDKAEMEKLLRKLGTSS